MKMNSMDKVIRYIQSSGEPVAKGHYTFRLDAARAIIDHGKSVCKESSMADALTEVMLNSFDYGVAVGYRLAKKNGGKYREHRYME